MGRANVHDTNPPATAIRTLGDWIEGRLIGRSTLVERLLIGLLTGGHVLVSKSVDHLPL